MTTPPKRPHSDRGQGRKSLQGSGPSPSIQARVTPEQKATFKKLGGAGWLRKVLDLRKQT